MASQKMRRLVLRLLVAVFTALQFGALLALLLTAKVSAAALPVSSSASETPQTTISTTYVASHMAVGAETPWQLTLLQD